MRVRVPRQCWIGHITTKYRNVGLKVYSYVKMGDETLINAYVYRSGSRVIKDLEELPCVKKLTVISGKDDVFAIRVVCSCPLSDVFSKTMTIPPVPFEVSNGVANWDLSDFDKVNIFNIFRDEAKKAGGSIRVVKKKVDGLTERQREVLRIAISLGYYDYPRKITLSELASKLGVSKASLSEMLMKIESKVIKKYFE